MSENPPENPIVENVEPPEVKLTAPTLSITESTWLVVAKNNRVISSSANYLRYSRFAW
ncbi:hypothetical protein JYQ62_33880 [Nostoc sp. UHCC 0702]|nr:hypothetical protein JYQ62_33880 [Nostoc sp. UHCC 0702]